MKRLIFIICAIIIGVQLINAESKRSMWRPNWTYNIPPSKSSAYAYNSFKGIGASERESRKDAYAKAMQASQSQLGIMASSDEINKAVNEGKDFNVVSQNYSIPMWEVCQYTIKDGTDYYYWILMRIASDANKSVSREPFDGDCADFSKASELRAMMRDEFQQDIEEAKQREKEEKEAAEKAARQAEKVARQEARTRRLNVIDFPKERYVAWRIVGAGYPWNLTSGVNFRYGFYEFLGIGAYLDLGADFTHVNVTLVSGDKAKTTSCHFHYSGGVKFYPYRGLFVDCGFTSKTPAHQNVLANLKISSFDKDSDGWLKNSSSAAKIIKNAIEQSNAIMFGVGYDLVTNRNDKFSNDGFYLGVSVGAMYDINSKKFSPTASLRIGVAWSY